MVLGISKGWIHVIYYSNVERLEHLAAPSEAHSDPMDSSHPFRLSLYLVHQGTVGQWGGRHVYWGSCVRWGLGAGVLPSSQIHCLYPCGFFSVRITRQGAGTGPQGSARERN